MRVLDGIATALGCTVDDLTGSRAHTDAPHVLLYCVDATGPLFATVDHAFGTDVDHWIYIADPRHTEVAPEGRATICAWEFGAFPYAASHLEPQNILTALEQNYSFALNAEAEGQKLAGSSQDAVEGGMAFLQKRKPEFKGR